MSSQPEIDMRPGGEVASNFHPHPQADSSAGEDLPFKNLTQSLLNERMDRRTVLKRGVGLLAGSMLGGITLARPDRASADANADIMLVGEPTFLPVITTEKDVKLKHIDLPKVDADPELLFNPPDLPVEDVSVNQNLDAIVRRNRIGIAALATMMRNDALASTYFDLSDPEPDFKNLINLFAAAGDLPPVDIDGFLLRAEKAREEGKPLNVLAMAKTSKSPNKPVITTYNALKSINVRYVATPGSDQMSYQSAAGKIIDTYDYEVDDEGQLTMKVYWDNSPFRGNGRDSNELYNTTFSVAVARGFGILAATGGAEDSNNDALFGYVKGNYGSEQVMNLEFFPELFPLIMGERDQASGRFLNPIINVKLAS